MGVSTHRTNTHPSTTPGVRLAARGGARVAPYPNYRSYTYAFKKERPFRRSNCRFGSWFDGLGLARGTVRKMLRYATPPGYRRRQPARRPKLDHFSGSGFAPTRLSPMNLITKTI